tara:strand:+ start:685 stop:888 length:204 start_codon:yes stop_codon:yes gene_type:complete
MKNKEREDKIKALLDEEFLVRLTEIARLYGWRADFIEVASFIEDLYEEAEIELPELQPYDIDFSDES